MSTSHLGDLIGSYLAGELSAEQAAEVRAYLESTPGRRGVIAGIRAAVRGDDVAALPSVDVMHAQLMSRLESSLDAHSIPEVPRENFSQYRTRKEWFLGRQPPRASRWQKITGGALAAIGSGVVWFVVSTTAYHKISAPVLYKTSVGERLRVSLPDGNLVILNAASQLEVPGNYQHGDHTLRLRGEALFDITHHTSIPISVIAGNTVTRVLGTGFDVRHYAGDANVRVVVVSGKVSVGVGQLVPVTLAAGFMGTVRDSTVVTAPLANIDTYTSWTNGRLEFRRTPVPEMLATLERWYGIRFRLADTTLASETVTAALDYGSTTELVSALESILGVSATFEMTPGGKMITLASRKGVHAPVGRELRQDLSFPTTEVGR